MKRYVIIYLAFLVFFSVFMYILARYETAIDRRQMVRLMESHPELEAEIISLWGKPQDHRLFMGSETKPMKDMIHFMEEKYGYKFGHTISEEVVWIFWGVGILAGTMLAVVLRYRERRSNQEDGHSRRKLQEMNECLERFRQGEFEDIPDYEERSEEWMKVWESLREMGVYFAGLRRRLIEEENSTKILITDISHQLKTPLASLRMCHELTTAGQLTKEERREFQEQEEREIEKLEVLLNELVNLSRLEMHMIQIKPVSSSLKQTIAAAVSQIYMKAKSKNIEIRMEMDEDKELLHDTKWTEEAIANVLDNAVKYSGEHTMIMVRVTSLVRNTLIEIEDEGIGIRPEELTKIYQRFYRGDEARKTVKEGAGVGLYLSRMILERQGGTISAKRKKGNGTVFRITLPG